MASQEPPPPPSPKTPTSSKNRNCLSLTERMEAIRLLNTGLSARKVAIQLGVGRTQINDINKKKRKIEDEFEKNANPDSKRTCHRTYEDINNLTWTWFQDVRIRKFQISGPLIQERALSFAKELGITTFKGSNGWLGSFLKRHNIVFRTMSGERGDVDLTTVTDWKDRVPTIIDDYSPEDIFNMDETGLFYRDSTRNGYVVKGEDCGGGKHSKERITVALCASMTGEFHSFCGASIRDVYSSMST